MKNAARLFYKDKFLLSAFVLFFGWIHFRQIQALQYVFQPGRLDDVYPLENSLRMTMFCFIFFLFFSYEFFYKVRASRLEECADAIQNGRLKLMGMQALTLLGLMALVTLTFLGYNVFVYFYLSIGHTDYLVHIVRQLLLDVFLLSLLAGVTGLCAALVFRRLTAYLLLTLFVLLTSPLLENIMENVYASADLNLYPVYEFFHLYVPSLNWTPNYYIAFSLLPYRVELMLCWLFLFASAALGRLLKGRGRIRLAAVLGCLVFCAANAALYFSPSSKIIMSNNPDACLTHDLLYYWEQEQKSEPADFAVTAYELDITVKNRLSVRATLHVDKNDREKYPFTLYRGYRIQTVTNQDNEALPFSQEGDYFLVHSDHRRVDEIRVTYAGSSPKFFSNSQGVCLPGYFPYYPHSGFHSLYFGQGFERVLLETPVNFQVTVHSPRRVYTNLAEVTEARGEDSFSGVTDGVTLASGFLESTEYNGVEIVYPYLFSSEFNETVIRQSMGELAGKADLQSCKTIFLLPSLNLLCEETVRYADHITARQILTLPRNYETAHISDRKKEVYSLAEMYQNDREEFEEMIRREEEEMLRWEEQIKTQPEEPEPEQPCKRMKKKIGELGEEAVFAAAEEYVADMYDVRSTMEFLEQLGQ